MQDERNDKICEQREKREEKDKQDDINEQTAKRDEKADRASV